MNNKLSKKLRKYVDRKHIEVFNAIIGELFKLPLKQRLFFAYRLILKKGVKK